MNGIRIYFETKDLLGSEVKCYGDYLKHDTEVIVTDWGMHELTEVGLRKVQPYWLLPIVEAKKSEVVFPDYEGRFNEYPVVK